MKQVRYTQGRMAERSKAPDSRNSPLRLLVHECVRGFESTPVKFCVQKGNTLIEAVSNPTPVEFYVQKANILVEAVVLRVKWEARQTDFTLQEGVIEDRMKQVRYTQGRMAERSKAPDSRNSPLRLLVHECVRGFESTPVKFCVQKGNTLIEAVSNPTPVEFYVQKANILVEAVVLRVKWEARQTDFTLQEGAIEDRMKQVRYTQGRMVERSKAPDSWKSPSRLLAHECVRRFESLSCQILRSKRQHFNRSSIESHSCQNLKS